MTEAIAVTESLESENQGVKTEPSSKPSYEDALKKLADYEADASKNADLMKKLRKFEKENKDKAEREAVEAGKYKDLYDAANQKLTEMETKAKAGLIDGALKDALTEAKVKSIPTVLKLLDKSKVEVNEDGSVDSKSITQMLKELRITDPIFFDDVQQVAAVMEPQGTKTVVVPNLHRAGEGQVKDTFSRELGAAKTMNDIRKLAAAYQGKI